MSSEPAIRVTGLGKCYELYARPHDRLKQFLWQGRRRFYREFWALRDVSFEVEPGEVLGIVGRNGSGKSTLLQLICGTLAPTTGTVARRGRVAALLELGAGFNPEFTGLENVHLQGALMGFTPEEVEERVQAIEAFADIGEFLHQPLKQYSSGMFIRLAFACAVNVDPDILVVDEALAVGDVRFQLKCHRKFEEFREMGKTILLVSHSCPDIVRLCRRALWLDEGGVREQGDPARVVESYLAWMTHDTGVLASLPVSGGKEGGGEDELSPVPAKAFVTGEGGAVIRAVGLFGEDQRRLAVINGPTPVRLVFEVVTRVALDLPYFAFQIINSRGLRILGSNTCVLNTPVEPIGAGATVRVGFRFDFPEIENGTYLIALGVADGTSARHIRHAYMTDASEIQCLSNSAFQTQAVLLKLPDCMADVQIGRGS